MILEQSTMSFKTKCFIEKKKVNYVLGHQESDNASIWNDYTSVLPTLGCG